MHSAWASRAAVTSEVGVVEDDGGGLAAELEGDPGDPLAAQRGDPPAGRRRAGEGDLVDPRIAHQQLGHLTVGGHHVEDAGGQPDLLGDLGHQVALARGLRRRLEHHRAPGDEGGGDLVADQGHRAVPRDDGAHHPDGLPDEQAEAGLAGLRLALPLEGVGQARVEVERAGRSGTGVTGDPVQHPGLAGPDLPDLLRPGRQPGTQRRAGTPPAGRGSSAARAPRRTPDGRRTRPGPCRPPGPRPR